jgi:hypothetical protein
VSGTLTVNGATINTSGTNSAVKSTDGAVITKVQSVVSAPIGIVGTESNHDLGVYTNNTNRLNVSAAGVISISGTTASTSTSTGALTVGNGVSGGLGVGGAVNVGGAINAGGAITAGADGSLVAVYVPGESALRAAGGKLYIDTRVTDGGDIVLRPRVSAALTLTAATNAATFTGAVSVSSTTASTSTSSGALVVSGGVGVAKEMYLGGGLLNVAKAGAGATIEINADSGFASKLAMQRAATNRWTLEVDSSDVLTLKSLGTTAALTMTGTTSAEFVGSIKTGAPSGGTAAAWKLGTVASVSPTSPNRTIEVDIGGTIYYIHAKTTNN